MTDDVIQRARRNLLSIRAELAQAKTDVDDPGIDLEQVLVAVEIVKADAQIAQVELLAAMSAQLSALLSREHDAHDPA